MKRNSSGRQSAKTLNYLPLPFVFAAIVLLAFVSVSGRIHETERELGRGVISHAATEMQSVIIEVLEDSSKLPSAIEADRDLGKAGIASIAKELLEKYPFITGISTAPSAIIQYHFPEAAGSGTIGHDLLTNPERRETLVEAVARKGYVLSGPFDDFEGRSVLFARYPVFVANSLWGFTSLSIDFEKMMHAIDFEGRYPGFAFAVSGAAGEREDSDDVQGEGAFLFGSKAAYERGLKSEWLQLPGTGLVLHLMPARGWSKADPYLFILLIAGLSGAFFLLAALYLRLPSRVLQQTAASGPLDQAVRDVRAARGLSSQRTEPQKETPGPGVKVPAVPVLPEMRQPVSDPVAPPPEAPHPVDNERTTASGTTFKGPDVKGELYMPDVLFSGDPGSFAERFGLKGKKPEEKDLEEDLKVDLEEDGTFIEPPSRQDGGIEEEETATADTKSAKAEEMAPAPVISIPAAESRPAPTPYILVVDDSSANRDIMGRMLSLRGYHADFAASGEEAVSACAVRPYDIVFMDCFMPGMDGYRAAVLLRSAPVSSRATIIGMSARTGSQELQRCRDAGMDHLMVKPFTLTQVMGYLEKPSLS